jgi:hypothetical protein
VKLFAGKLFAGLQFAGKLFRGAVSTGPVIPTIPDGDGGGGGGYAIRNKLVRKFKDDQERTAALSKLTALDDKKRVALKKAAKDLANLTEVSYTDTLKALEYSLVPFNETATENHLDWLLYFVRVEAYKQDQLKQQRQEQKRLALLDDENALVALLLSM